MSKHADYDINDARQDVSESIFVMNHASRMMKKPSVVLMPHTSRDSGDARSFVIPRTTNPIDLSTFAPKDEILRNPEFLRFLRSGILKLISPVEAEGILYSPQGRIESERLVSDHMRALSNNKDTEKDGAFKATLSEEMKKQRAQGEVDEELVGVSPAVIQIINDTESTSSQKAVMIAGYASDGLLTDEDKRWIRKNTNDKEIRAEIEREF